MYLLTHLVLLNSHRQAHLLLFQLTLLAPSTPSTYLPVSSSRSCSTPTPCRTNPPFAQQTNRLPHSSPAPFQLCVCLSPFSSSVNALIGSKLGNLLLHLIDISLSLHQILEVVTSVPDTFSSAGSSSSIFVRIKLSRSSNTFTPTHLIEECKRLVRTHTEEGYHLFAICHRTIKNSIVRFVSFVLYFFVSRLRQSPCKSNSEKSRSIVNDSATPNSTFSSSPV